MLASAGRTVGIVAPTVMGSTPALIDDTHVT
jgi:hypothetical protein